MKLIDVLIEERNYEQSKTWSDKLLKQFKKFTENKNSTMIQTWEIRVSTYEKQIQCLIKVKQ